MNPWTVHKSLRFRILGWRMHIEFSLESAIRNLSTGMEGPSRELPDVDANSSFKHTNGKVIPKLFVLSPINEDALVSQFASVLQSCSDASAIQNGRQIHAQVVVNGRTNNSLLGTKILGMYVLCDSIMDAKNMFYKLELCYALPWNWMIRGFTMKGWFDLALLFYFKMLGSKTSPDKYTLPYVIKACGGLHNVRLGKIVHDTIRLMGFEEDRFVGSSLIKLYADNGHIHDARCLFDKISQKDCILWNVMINGYMKNGDTTNAIRMFQEMRHCEIKPNSVTFASILSVCSTEVMIYFGTQLHGLVVSNGLELHSPVPNTLLTMYSKCGNLSEARKLFDTYPWSDLVTWNGMIAGYVQNRFMNEASNLFNRMISARVKPDSITFASFLPSVIESRSLKQGKEIHGYIVRHAVPLDVFLKSALIDLYFKCWNVESATRIFHQIKEVDVVMCTAMISGYALNGMNSNALEVFRWLITEDISPNCLTLASVLPACTGLAALKLGKELHANTLKNRLDVKLHVGSAITDMYAKCGRLDLAHLYFIKMPERDAVCWNSIITSFSQHGKPQGAIDLFRQMGIAGTKYDSTSISAAVSACANLPALYYGREIHGLVIRGALNSDIFVDSALIDMYSKCGNLDTAQYVFDMMHLKNEVSWNSMIAAYGNHGRLTECLDLFHEMLETGHHPDHVTFLSIISACGHAGQVDKGICYFRCMTDEYEIPAQMEHYACMVDLYGRAGRLNEAFETIKRMPFTPDAGVWGTLLGACRVHGNVELAGVASRHLLDLDPQNSGYYVLLSNIHADAGEWGSVSNIRSLMKERGVQKIPGYSWIDVNNITHLFVSADESHSQSVEMYLLLESLLLEMRKEGYVPQPYLPMHPQVMGKYQIEKKHSISFSPLKSNEETPARTDKLPIVLSKVWENSDYQSRLTLFSKSSKR
ncbi:Pentatricopeptide repeat-containing protein [Quillaja saponaria]|uniref:Pentatricopeptide repeat-containing protein n=1 Tax=Quillaja saponaria TaxID=32244 RepID=A0AAD7PLN7_QUISA|nr:Pentatricopeptide repeat-containing protein [Quillaja saponaria]